MKNIICVAEEKVIRGFGEIIRLVTSVKQQITGNII